MGSSVDDGAQYDPFGTERMPEHHFRAKQAQVPFINLSGNRNPQCDWNMVHDVDTSCIIGAMLMTCIALVIGQGFVMNWYYWKKTGLEIGLF